MNEFENAMYRLMKALKDTDHMTDLKILNEWNKAHELIFNDDINNAKKVFNLCLAMQSKINTALDVCYREKKQQDIEEIKCILERKNKL